jgi:hypothetical protein
VSTRSVRPATGPEKRHASSQGCHAPAPHHWPSSSSLRGTARVPRDGDLAIGTHGVHHDDIFPPCCPSAGRRRRRPGGPLLRLQDRKHSLEDCRQRSFQLWRDVVGDACDVYGNGDPGHRGLSKLRAYRLKERQGLHCRKVVRTAHRPAARTRVPAARRSCVPEPAPFILEAVPEAFWILSSSSS